MCHARTQRTPRTETRKELRRGAAKRQPKICDAKTQDARILEAVKGSKMVYSSAQFEDNSADTKEERSEQKRTKGAIGPYLFLTTAVEGEYVANSFPKQSRDRE
jgi:hypothetical protein